MAVIILLSIVVAGSLLCLAASGSEIESKILRNFYTKNQQWGYLTVAAW
jgi:hypothetical protein